MARVSTATRLPVLGLLALVGLGCGARSDLGAPRDEANGGSASNGGSGGSGGMGSDGGAPAGCGNGVVEGREQCDEGALNEDIEGEVRRIGAPQGQPRLTRFELPQRDTLERWLVLIEYDDQLWVWLDSMDLLRG